MPIENPVKTKIICRRSFLTIFSGALAIARGAQPESTPLPNRPKVPGTMLLRARLRVEQPPGSGSIRVTEEPLRWEVAQTAIIIIDMWDAHTCHLSAQRVAAVCR